MKLPSWVQLLARNRASLSSALTPLREQGRKPAAGAGDWLMGMVAARRYWLFRPAGVKFGERLPLMVMLHGCHQDAKSFAASTRMNALAARERFLVLYPEQDRLSNPQGCWNWFDLKTGRAQAEAASIMATIERVCVLYAADRPRVAIAGMSAGASMAALLAIRYPARFKAVAMHSGVPPGSADSGLSAARAMRGGLQPLPLSSAERLPPLMVIHGDGDRLVSARNADAAARLWAEAGGAKETAPRAVRRGQRHPMTVTEFKRARRSQATLVLIHALGHGWSGGAAKAHFSDPEGPDATRMIWRFAAKHFLP
jgi:poly(hydroxyalkanoate) depolymerase family esterase